MTNAKSSKTVAIAFRVSVDDFAILEKRAKRMGMKVSEYQKHKTHYDLHRKHERVK